MCNRRYHRICVHISDEDSHAQSALDEDVSNDLSWKCKQCEDRGNNGTKLSSLTPEQMLNKPLMGMEDMLDILRKHTLDMSVDMRKVLSEEIGIVKRICEKNQESLGTLTKEVASRCPERFEKGKNIYRSLNDKS